MSIPTAHLRIVHEKGKLFPQVKACEVLLDGEAVAQLQPMSYKVRYDWGEPPILELRIALAEIGDLTSVPRGRP